MCALSTQLLLFLPLFLFSFLVSMRSLALIAVFACLLGVSHAHVLFNQLFNVEAPTNQCTNAADMSAISKPSFVNKMIECLEKNYHGGETYAECVHAATGLSKGCASCMGAEQACGWENCDTLCLKDAEDCHKCEKEHCAASAGQCTGFHLSQTPAPLSTSPSRNFALASVMAPTKQCLNAADMKEIVSPDFKDKAIDCDKEFFMDSAKYSACLHVKTGLSTGCSNCMGSLQSCTVAQCMDECQQGQQQCEACQLQKCVPAFDNCAGFPAPQLLRPFVTSSAEPKDECANKQDVAILYGSAFGDDNPADVAHMKHVEACGKEFWNDPAKFTECAHSKGGLTIGCAGCVSALQTCTIVECLAECEADECESCRRHKCYPQFSTCTGIPGLAQVVPQFPNPALPKTFALSAEPKESSAPTGQCMDSKDMGVLTSAAFQKIMKEKCVPLEDQSGCAAYTQCLHAQAGLSMGCSTCMGNLVACTLSNKCQSECSGGESQCQACVQEKCMAPYYQCSGFPSSAPMVI